VVGSAGTVSSLSGSAGAVSSVAAAISSVVGAISSVAGSAGAVSSVAGSADLSSLEDAKRSFLADRAAKGKQDDGMPWLQLPEPVTLVADTAGVEK